MTTCSSRAAPGGAGACFDDGRGAGRRWGLPQRRRPGPGEGHRLGPRRLPPEGPSALRGNDWRTGPGRGLARHAPSLPSRRPPSLPPTPIRPPRCRPTPIRPRIPPTTEPVRGLGHRPQAWSNRSFRGLYLGGRRLGERLASIRGQRRHRAPGAEPGRQRRAGRHRQLLQPSARPTRPTGRGPVGSTDVEAEGRAGRRLGQHVPAEGEPADRACSPWAWRATTTA